MCIRDRKGTAPYFRPMSIVANGWIGWIKMPLGTEVNISPGDVVSDGVAGCSSPPLKGAQPQFSTHVYCDQTAGWMKTPVGTEVDLGPGHIVLDGDPAPSPAKGAQPLPLFCPCLLWSRSPVSAAAELLLKSKRLQ